MYLFASVCVAAAALKGMQAQAGNSNYKPKLQLQLI